MFFGDLWAHLSAASESMGCASYNTIWPSVTLHPCGSLCPQWHLAHAIFPRGRAPAAGSSFLAGIVCPRPGPPLIVGDPPELKTEAADVCAKRMNHALPFKIQMLSCKTQASTHTHIQSEVGHHPEGHKCLTNMLLGHQSAEKKTRHGRQDVGETPRQI